MADVVKGEPNVPADLRGMLSELRAEVNGDEIASAGPAETPDGGAEDAGATTTATEPAPPAAQTAAAEATGAETDDQVGEDTPVRLIDIDTLPEGTVFVRNGERFTRDDFDYRRSRINQKHNDLDAERRTFESERAEFERAAKTDSGQSKTELYDVLDLRVRTEPVAVALDILKTNAPEAFQELGAAISEYLRRTHDPMAFRVALSERRLKQVEGKAQDEQRRLVEGTDRKHVQTEIAGRALTNPEWEDVKDTVMAMVGRARRDPQFKLPATREELLKAAYDRVARTWTTPQASTPPASGAPKPKQKQVPLRPGASGKTAGTGRTVMDDIRRLRVEQGWA